MASRRATNCATPAYWKLTSYRNLVFPVTIRRSLQPSKESTINTPSLTPSQPQAPHNDSSNASPSLVPMVPRSELFFMHLLGGARTPNLMIYNHVLYLIKLHLHWMHSNHSSAPSVVTLLSSWRESNPHIQCGKLTFYL